MPGDGTKTAMLEATAYWTAAVRAWESARQDALFRDPWAAALAGPEGAAWIERRSPDSVLPMVLRTRFFDDWLETILRDGACRQVVLPAAGLDTRAFRLSWPADARCFEIDRPAVLRYKQTTLDGIGARPRCLRIPVEADLAEPWVEALVDAGFDDRQPATWLLEGFLFYVAAEVIARILDEVTRLSVPGSRLGFDIVNSAMLTAEWTKAWLQMQADEGAPWIGTMDDPIGSLGALGWRASLTQAGQPDANHGRWTLPILSTAMPDVPHDWFVTAERFS